MRLFLVLGLISVFTISYGQRDYLTINPEIGYLGSWNSYEMHSVGYGGYLYYANSKFRSGKELGLFAGCHYFIENDVPIGKPYMRNNNESDTLIVNDSYKFRILRPRLGLQWRVLSERDFKVNFLGELGAVIVKREEIKSSSIDVSGRVLLDDRYENNGTNVYITGGVGLRVIYPVGFRGSFYGDVTGHLNFNGAVDWNNEIAYPIYLQVGVGYQLMLFFREPGCRLPSKPAAE